jgi:hypothetical protein
VELRVRKAGPVGRSRVTARACHPQGRRAARRASGAGA